MGFDKFRRKVIGTKAEFTEQVVVIKGALTAGSATPYSLVNPYAVALIVNKVVIDLTSPVSTTPVAMSVGIGSTAHTKYETLIDDVVIGTPVAIGLFDNIDDQGTNGKASEKWGATEYLNVFCSATPTGLKGNIYIYCRKA